MAKGSKSSNVQTSKDATPVGHTPASASQPAAANNGDTVAAILDRLQVLRQQLVHRAKNEDKAGSRGDCVQALISDLDEISNMVNVVSGMLKRQGIGAAETSGHRQVLDDEAHVHYQTLRLAYAAALPEASTSHSQAQSVVGKFYTMLTADIAGEKPDEKLSPSTMDIAQHLQSLCSRKDTLVPGWTEPESVSYRQLAEAVDQLLKPSTAEPASAKSTGKSQAVKMPKIAALTVDPGSARSEDSEFSMQVVVPPGGLSFIAADDAVEGADDKDKSYTKQAAPMSSMPEPTQSTAADKHGSDEGHKVGGFAHPTRMFAGPTASAKAAAEEGGSELAGANNAVSMPVPDDNAPMGHQHAGGFGVFGMPMAGAAGPGWTAAAAAAAAATGASGVSVPGAFGMMPLPYPPHIAMQYGYLPPHMYSMPGPNPVGMAAAAATTGTPASGSPAAANAVLATTMPPVAGMAESWAKGQLPMGNMEAGGNKAAMIEHGAEPNAMVQQAMMPGIDMYHQQMMMMMGGGGTFVYPHVDASNLSTAATGGSENNESLHSVELGSNSSRPTSMHLQQQQQQPPAKAVAEARGLASSEHRQQAAASSYMWTPQEKQVAQQPAYGYSYQQPYYQHSGYRRRGSGSTSNNSSSNAGANQQNRNRNNNFHRKRWNDNYHRHSQLNSGGQAAHGSQPEPTEYSNIPASLSSSSSWQ
ncbi:hypothetical protein EV183_001709 [Coemansia sp. RSA 2336]|nr:hypothetical protein EV183_001709 [Coemansia sp. RSA 2336]